MPTDHGTTRDGTPITEEMIESFADEAEAGYEVQDILRRREARQRREPDGGALGVRRSPSVEESRRSLEEEPGRGARA